ncbi:asb110 [Agrotis segetum nucleopolyhedrovirus B]|uniref:Asb110 n=1 Tax=Agrotis segetum nucleopolyhedrovirus B TaxID=1580580 RepID=A0A0A7KRH7_9ABAC|nr:asb110 [Agrotis segetum nucleopolyhedrovirus B]AIZ48667.1 asb110 [Agrotis segetum nucleopolyhedrovirus B]
MTFEHTLASRSTCRRSAAPGEYLTGGAGNLGHNHKKCVRQHCYQITRGGGVSTNMSQLNFKLKEVIDNTVNNKLRSKSNQDTLASFYDKRKSDVAQVGRSTTYDVVGKRDYKTLFDERKYKF